MIRILLITLISSLLLIACGIKDRPEYNSNFNYKKTIKIV